MGIRWTVLAFALVVNVAGAARADRGKVQFDCNAAAGALSSISLPRASERHLVTGKIRADALYRDDKWRPHSQVMISDGSKWAGISLASDRPKSTTQSHGASVTVRIIRGAKGQTPETEDLVAIDLGQEVPFSLNVAEKALEIRIAGTGRTLDLPLSHEQTIELGCSTGDFEFIDVASE